MNLTIETEHGRGCGDRTEGDVYACCGLSSSGYSFEYFMYDPVPYQKWQRGCEIVPRNSDDPCTVYDLWIYVGRDPKDGATDGYPSCWSFASEVGKFGLSRKTPKNMPYHLLKKGKSLIKLIHPHAIPTFDYQVNKDRPYSRCKLFRDWANDKDRWAGFYGYHPYPAKPETHGKDELATAQKCTFALRDLACLDHFANEVCQASVMSYDLGDDDLWFRVEMPSFAFTGQWPRRIDFENVSWKPGIFMWLPLSHFEIPHSDNDNMVSKLNSQGWEAVVTEW